MSNFHFTILFSCDIGREGQRRLVAEVVLDAGVEGSSGAFDTLSRTLLVPSLERVLDAIPDALVTAGGKNLAKDIATSPVSGVRLVLRSVDELGPALFHFLAFNFNSSAEVELIAYVEVNGRLGFDFTFLVVFGEELHKNEELAISFVLCVSCRQIDFVRHLQK